MAQEKINSGEVLNLYDLRDEMPKDATLALMKTDDMEVIRMVLPKGKEVTEHSVNGQISVQCLKGKVTFAVDNQASELSQGDWLYLKRNQPHSLQALTNSVLLVTILFTHNKK
ncbi:MAG TPA: cupin domain-containing protein [Balneolaceae bacterium]|nr:cupin domain-containing protein [Balneolaceae bacterium]